MVFLNIVYGLLMAIAASVGMYILEGFVDLLAFIVIWFGWTSVHIIYDIVAYGTVKLFNRNQVVTKDMLR